MGNILSIWLQNEIDAKCSETDFWVNEFFFCAILSFWDMIDFDWTVVNNELRTCENSGRDFCEPDSDANQWG